jgi:hypothetical protein
MNFIVIRKIELIKLKQVSESVISPEITSNRMTQVPLREVENKRQHFSDCNFRFPFSDTDRNAKSSF